MRKYRINMPSGMVAKDVTTTIKDGGSFMDVECFMEGGMSQTDRFKAGDILAVRDTTILCLYAGTVRDFRDKFDKSYIGDAIVYHAVYSDECNHLNVHTDVGVGRLSDGKLRQATYEEKAKFRRELLRKGYVWDNGNKQVYGLKPFDVVRIDTDIDNFNRKYMICLVPYGFKRLCDENHFAPFNYANVNLSGAFSTQCGIKALIDVRLANEEERNELAEAIQQMIIKH